MLIMLQTMCEGWACLVSLEAMITKPANEQLVLSNALCVVFLFACMYVCVFDFGYRNMYCYIRASL